MKLTAIIIILLTLLKGIAIAGDESPRIITLEDAICIGLKNNKKFLLEQTRQEMSIKNTYLNAKAEYSRPVVDSSLSLFQEKKLKVSANQKFLIPKTGAVVSLENDYDFKNTDSGTTLGVTLSQPLSPKEFLSNRRIFKDIKDDYNLSLLSLNRHKQDFMNEVINAYINLIRQEMSIEINQKSIKTQDELLTITNLKYKAGDVPRIDMIDLELQNKLDKMNMLTEKDNCRKAKKGFLKTLGLDKDVEFTISQDIKPLLDSSPPLIEAMNSAKDYQLIESKISLKRKEQTLKEAQLSKNIAVFMEAGCSSRLPFDSSEEKSKESRAGIKVEYKIYDNSSYKRAVILLQKEFEIEQDNFQEQGKNIEDEIKELYKEIDLIRQKKELLSTMEKISHDLLEAGKLKFNLGIISQSELNNIIERYNKTQKEMIESKIESFSIGIRLLTLTCGLVAFYSSGGL